MLNICKNVSRMITMIDVTTKEDIINDIKKMPYKTLMTLNQMYLFIFLARLSQMSLNKGVTKSLYHLTSYLDVIKNAKSMTVFIDQFHCEC